MLAHPVTAATVNYPAWFRIFNAWPTALAYSDLDAGANQLLIEQMTLAHEGFDFGLASNLGQDAPAAAGTPVGVDNALELLRIRTSNIAGR